jgi:iron complex outermembrane receptor protein
MILKRKITAVTYILPYLFVFLLSAQEDTKQNQQPAEVKTNTSTEDKNVISPKKKDIPEENFFKLEDRIVVTASRTKENLQNAPASVIVITEEDIRNRGYASIDEILYDLPGFDLSFSNGIPYIMGYQRGYRTPFMSRTLFMIDSKIQNDMYTQEAELSRQVPMSNIKRIEVLYGPASAAYGPNAFQGIINIITHDGSSPKKGKESENGNYSSSKVSLQAGSYNSRSIDAGAHAKIGDWLLAASGKVFKSDEPDLSNRSSYNTNYWYSNPTVWGPMRYNRNNDRTLSSYYDPTRDYGAVASVTNGAFKVGGIIWSRNEGYGMKYPGDRAQNNGMWEVLNKQSYLEYTSIISPSLTSTTLLSYRESAFRGQWAEAEPDWNTGRKEYSYLSQTYWGNQNKSWLLNHNWEYKATSNLQFNTGVKFEKRDMTKQYDIPGYWPGSYNSWNEYEGKPAVDLTSIYPNGPAVQPSSNPVYIKLPDGKKRMPYNNIAQVYDMGGFAIATYEIGKFRFSPGMRYDHNSLYGQSVNPRATAIYKYTRSGAIKLLYGEAFQEPAFILLFGGWSGRKANQNLKPEKERTTELILMEQFHNWLAEVSLYYSRYENVIKETAKNEGSRKIYGLELRNKILFGNPVPNSSKMDVFFYYTYTEALSESYYNFDAPKTNWTPANVNPEDWISGRTVLGKYENDYYTANPNTPPLPRKKSYSTLGDISPHKVSLGINLPIQSIMNINLRANYVGPRELYLSNELRNKGLPLQRDKGIILDNYILLNGSFSFLFKYTTLVVKVFNLLNHSYSHPGQEQADSGNNFYDRSGGYRNSILPQPGRYFLFTLNFEF